MPARTKNTTTRARRVRNEEPEAPIVLGDETNDLFTEREPLFSLGGQVYTIPVEVSGADSLHYATIWMNQGITAALVWGLRQCVGDEAYMALVTHKSLTQEQLSQLFDAIRSKFDGSSDPKD